jgi:hypothetical protein
LAEGAIELAIRDRITLVVEVGPEQIAIPGTVANMTPDEVWVGVTGAAVDRLPLCTMVRLAVATPSGSVTAESEVIRIVGANGRMVALSRPKSWQTDLRRTNARVALALPAYLQRIGDEGLAAARTTNVSVGSFQCLTDMAVEVGERVRATLLLSPLIRFECLAQVVRIENDSDDPAGRKLAVAFRFLELTEADEAQVAAAVAAIDQQTEPAGPPGPV